MVRQSSTKHLAIRSLSGPRYYSLKQGENRREWRVPVRGLPDNQQVFRIRFEGGLPGSDLTATLRSNEVEVVVD